MIFNQQRTLLSRVTKNIFLVTMALFLMFSAVTFFIVYGFEDATFEENLRQTGQAIEAGASLPQGYQVVDDLSQFELSPLEHLKFLDYDFDGPFLEFEYQGTHYHSMRYKNGFLVLNTKGKGLVRRAIGDITLLLLIMLIPVVFFSLYVARKISAYAIKPFTDVRQILLSDELDIHEAKQALNEINEQDIKQLAGQMLKALEQKSLMLQNQILFNQGMAHELKTPLQVMTHSIELLQQIEQTFTNTAAFSRLEKSVVRMKRISEALLWLTDESEEEHSTSVVQAVQTILTENQPLLSAQKINVDLHQDADLLLPLPEIVMELIVFNLLNNVVHHCQVSELDKNWRINIEQDKVSFSNPIAIKEQGTSTEKHFGLGLGLVEKLLMKFGLILEIKRNEQQFSVIIVNESNV